MMRLRTCWRKLGGRQRRLREGKRKRRRKMGKMRMSLMWMIVKMRIMRERTRRRAFLGPRKKMERTLRSVMRRKRNPRHWKKVTSPLMRDMRIPGSSVMRQTKLRPLKAKVKGANSTIRKYTEEAGISHGETEGMFLATTTMMMMMKVEM
ncbi:MRC1-like domain-containing protein [Histoplasma ohiense]|nr:MRC1-like domain-containing protein [Histoplasma ohiense (nom. inval.)]